MVENIISITSVGGLRVEGEKGDLFKKGRVFKIFREGQSSTLSYLVLKLTLRIQR